jgi:hypothetical protein
MSGGALLKGTLFLNAKRQKYFGVMQEPIVGLAPRVRHWMQNCPRGPGRESASKAKNYLTTKDQSDIIPKPFPKYPAKRRISIP